MQRAGKVSVNAKKRAKEKSLLVEGTKEQITLR